MQAKKISVFDLFTHFDVNFNGRVCKLELKTGIQQLGLFLEQDELESLWRSMHKSQKYLKNDKTIESINEENRQLGQR
jgi:Ca2+-binding EF-hand superfamily protein